MMAIDPMDSKNLGLGIGFWQKVINILKCVHSPAGDIPGVCNYLTDNKLVLAHCYNALEKV